MLARYLRSWNTVRLGEVSTRYNGTTPATERPEYYGGGIPFVKTAEIDGRVILDTQVHVTGQAVRRVPTETVPNCNSLYWQCTAKERRVGRSALLGVPATTTQNTAAIECAHRLGLCMRGISTFPL